MQSSQSLKAKPLKPRQKIALQMTLDGHTAGEICDRLSITNRTLRNWRCLPNWCEEISVVLRGATEDGEGSLRTMLPLATRRLQQLIHSSSETVALGACRTAIEAHASLVAQEEQRAILHDLESQLSELREAATNRLPAGADLESIEVEIVPNESESESDELF